MSVSIRFVLKSGSDAILMLMLSAAMLFPFAGFAHGQQTNIHVSMPSLLSPEAVRVGQIYASYINMHGTRTTANGVDINTVYRRTDSATVTSNATVGAALLGGYLGGEMEVDALDLDLSGLVLHFDFYREYLVAKNSSSSLTLIVGLPLSFGDFAVEGAEDITVVNILVGVKGGARLGFDIGRLTASPLVVVDIMGGHIQRYTGGVYLANLSSGWVPIFAVVSTGVELLYNPLALTLSGIYQRTFESGDNKPIDTAMVRFGFSF